jgi:hypothetical protein
LPRGDKSCHQRKWMRPSRRPALRASVRRHRRALAPGRKAPTRSISKLARVRQQRTTVVNPVCGCSRDRNEEQDPGLRRSSVERNNEEAAFVRFPWGETKEQEADAANCCKSSRTIGFSLEFCSRRRANLGGCFDPPETMPVLSRLSRAVFFHGPAQDHRNMRIESHCWYHASMGPVRRVFLDPRSV